MTDAPLTTEPTPAADPALTERLRRIEEQLATREAAPANEEVARRVVTILTEKAAQQRALAEADPQVPGLMSTALTAARMAQTFLPNVPPGVAPQTAENGFRTWLLTQVVSEFRLMAMMYFDPRYRLSRVAQFGVPIILVLMVMNYFFISGMPFIGFLVERLVLVILAVMLYKVLAKEAARYKQVLDYLTQYGSV